MEYYVCMSVCVCVCLLFELVPRRCLVLCVSLPSRWGEGRREGGREGRRRGRIKRWSIGAFVCVEPKTHTHIDGQSLPPSLSPCLPPFRQRILSLGI